MHWLSVQFLWKMEIGVFFFKLYYLDRYLIFTVIQILIPFQSKYIVWIKHYVGWKTFTFIHKHALSLLMKNMQTESKCRENPILWQRIQNNIWQDTDIAPGLLEFRRRLDYFWLEKKFHADRGIQLEFLSRKRWV